VTWRWKLGSLLPRKEVEQELNVELATHIEMRAAELRQAGMSDEDAHLEARRRFGNPTLIREQTRERNVDRTLETFWQDARYGCRVLRCQPGFTIAAILILALAIGANGAIFSVMDALLFRPLPFPHPQQLVFLWGTNAQHQRTLISPADLDDWRSAKSFERVSAMMGQSVNLTGIDQPTRVVGGFVSPDYFPILGVSAAIGRTFSTAEGQPGGDPVTVIGYGVWQDRFGADPSLVGKHVILNGEPFTVIGILPREFNLPIFKIDVLLPSRFYPGYSSDRAQTSVVALGRLKPGVALGQAQTELDTLTRQLARAYPETNRDRSALLLRLHDVIAEQLRPSVLALAAAVGCLLLIACANIANLLLSKAAGRRREMSVRVALGAGRLRLVRQLLTESLILAMSGAALGVAIAYALARFVVMKLGNSWPAVSVDLNFKVLAFMACAAVLTTVLFGLAPALQARRAAVDGLRVRGDPVRSRLRNTLAIGQVALALVMLIGSGLMIESLKRLLHVDTGFDGSRVLTMEYRLPGNKYPSAAQQAHFHDEVVARVRALPGVEAVGIVRGLPFSGNGGPVTIGLPDRPAPPPADPFRALYNAATPTYFETVRIPLLAGRYFQRSDDSNARRVVLVSRSFVQRFWPDRNAIGRQVLIPDRDLAPGKTQTIAATVVGVVGNIRHDRLDEPEIPQLYVPYAQDPITFATLAVRTRGNPMDRVKDVQQAIWSVDRDQPMWKIRTLASLVEDSLGSRRLLLTLLGSFSVLALLLASLGLYGVMAYQVTQRTAEIGIRVALGAQPSNVLSMVLRQGLTLAVVGLVAGASLAPLLTRVLNSQLYGVPAVDLSVYAGFGGLLLAISVAAVLLPAWRATRLDPVQALRAE
jgi:putative ABC transport system permease protein